MQEAAGGSPQVLVVDDDALMRRLVRRALETYGYRDVLEADDGDVAQAVLGEHPDVALVITDIMMPKLNGLELLRWGQEHASGAVWILLSGLDTFDTAVEAIRLGAFDFLQKPPEMAQLEVAIRNALDHRRLLLEQERLYRELEEANQQLLTQVRELEDKSELLRRDLQRAEVIQRALLPRDPPAIERYCIQALYRPGRYVGGDLYDVIRLDERYVGIYVADATGHGVTAAMLSVLFKQRLAVQDEEGVVLAPAAVLEDVNRAFCEAVVTPGLFLTAVYCLLDVQNGAMRLASAGHPPALHVRAGGETLLIRRTGPALGLTTDAEYTEVSLQLARSDRLVLYTDGLLDAVGAAAPDDLRRVLHLEATAGQVLAELMAELKDRNGAGQDPDDVTLLLLDVRVGASRFDNGGAPEQATRAAPVSAQPIVYYGEAEDAGWLALRGRVTWQQCDVVYEAAGALLETQHAVVLDLSACDYLDSTCLGVVHQLVERGGVSLNGVPSPLRALFEELEMEGVLAAIVEDGVAPPELHPLPAGQAGTGGRLRILRAHEALAALSARNQERFRTVVESLRRDLERS
jgi:serine phosphatase RsbU (regulator of sigma subunit)/ABC-type transporter Mla MlaB component